MGNASNINLDRKLIELENEIARLKGQLAVTQQALLSANSVKCALAEHCEELLDKVYDTHQSNDDVSEERGRLQAILSEEWLAPLRMDAFSLGFEEGVVHAYTHRGKFSNTTEALDHYRAHRTISWPDRANAKTRDHYRRPRQAVLRYRFDPTDQEDLFSFSDEGEYVDYSAYAELKQCYDVLLQDLAGYTSMLKEPLAGDMPWQKKHDAAKNAVRRPRKPGILKLRFGKNNGDRDLFVLYGKDVPACDRALIMYAFTAKALQFDYQQRLPKFSPSLIEELAARGYDLSTLRFEIEQADPCSKRSPS